MARDGAMNGPYGRSFIGPKVAAPAPGLSGASSRGRGVVRDGQH